MTYSPMELADAFIKTGELTDALEALNQQLDENATDDIARQLRASVLLRLNKFEASIADLKQLSNLDTNDLVQLSVAYECLNQLDEAIAAMQSAMKTSNQSDRLIERLLQLYIAQKNYEQALNLVQAQPRHWRWLQWEADIFVLQGDDTQAIDRYNLAISQLTEAFDLEVEGHFRAMTGRLLLASAHAYVRLKQYNHAEERYLQTKEIIPDDPAIDFNRGVVLALQGQFEQAVDLCKTALLASSAFIQQELLADIAQQPNLQELHHALHNEL